jgi:hypothetical protein
MYKKIEIYIFTIAILCLSIFGTPKIVAQTEEHPPPMIDRPFQSPPPTDPFAPEKCRFGNPRNGKPTKIYGNNSVGWALDDSLLIAPEFVVIEGEYSDFMLAMKRVGNTFLRGAIDGKGQMVIPFEWHGLEEVSYEATVFLGRKDKKWGLLDEKGHVLQQIEDDYGLSLIAQKSYLLASPGRLRLFNQHGKMTFEGPYDWFFQEVVLPEKTWMAVKKGAFSGIVDSAGREIFPFKYTKILWATAAVVCVADSTKAQGLADWQGREILAPTYLHIHFPDENGLCSARNADQKMGLLAPDGRVVIPFEFNACWTDSFKKGLYRVEKNGRSGLYDATGKVVQSME